MAAEAAGVGGNLTRDIAATEDVADTQEESLASPFGKSITHVERANRGTVTEIHATVEQGVMEQLIANALLLRVDA